MNKITLRDYQKTVNENIYNAEERGIKRQLVVMATGAGKSFTITQVILDKVSKGHRVLILVDMEDLVWQWKGYIHTMNPDIRIGIEKADHKAKMTDQIVIATPQTLGREGRKRIKRFKPDHFSMCVIDEAHRSTAETWLRVLNYFGFGDENFNDDNLLVGLTATPYRSDGVSLGGNFDDIVANYDIRYLMHNGWLTDIELYSVQTSTDLRKYTTQGEVDEAVNNEARNLEVLKTYLEFGGVDQFIGYTASVAHAYELTKLFNDNGIPSAVIEGETDKVERKETLQKYKDGEIRGLFNHSTLTTGTDLPETSMLMLLRPIKSKLTLTQTIGRGIRPSASASVDMFRTKEQRIAAIEMSEKPVCKIIDMYDRVQGDTFTHIPSLFGLNNSISVDKGQRLFKEVVEPIEEAKNKHGIDPSSVLNINDISLIVKSRKLEIKSLTMDPEIEDFTDRVWITVSNGYEIIYGEDNKILLIEKDQTKSELINSEEWNLLEIDTKTNITKKLQTFKSLAGAFKIADEYADSNNWGSQFLKKNDWQEEGVTEKQMKMFERFFKYKTGYSKYELLDERYSDTGIRKIRWKDTGEVLTKGTASYILNDFFNSKKKK